MRRRFYINLNCLLYICKYFIRSYSNPFIYNSWGQYKCTVVADNWLIPKQMESYYHEKVIRLPNGIIGSYQPMPEPTEDRNSLGIDPASFVFASFNRIEKITPNTFAIWMDILKSVDHGILWISGEKSAVDHLKRVANKNGISPERIVFSESVPYNTFLNRLALADVFLDSHYYSAGATAVAAMNMGLPMVTCVDKSFTSRLGASVLAACNLEELICRDLQVYKLKAIELGTNADYYQSVKLKLKNPKQLPLFNNRDFAKSLEDEIIKLI